MRALSHLWPLPPPAPLASQHCCLRRFQNAACETTLIPIKYRNHAKPIGIPITHAHLSRSPSHRQTHQSAHAMNETGLALCLSSSCARHFIALSFSLSLSLSFTCTRTLFNSGCFFIAAPLPGCPCMYSSRNKQEQETVHLTRQAATLQEDASDRLNRTQAVLEQTIEVRYCCCLSVCLLACLFL